MTFQKIVILNFALYIYGLKVLYKQLKNSTAKYTEQN